MKVGGKIVLKTFGTVIVVYRGNIQRHMQLVVIRRSPCSTNTYKDVRDAVTRDGYLQKNDGKASAPLAGLWILNYNYISTTHAVTQAARDDEHEIGRAHV